MSTHMASWIVAIVNGIASVGWYLVGQRHGRRRERNTLSGAVLLDITRRVKDLEQTREWLLTGKDIEL